MSFTTNIFLFCLFPIFFAIYYCVQKHLVGRKLMIFIGNTVFYIYGGLQAFIVVCAICLLTWIFIKIVRKHHHKAVLTCGCIMILLPLLIYKYTEFIVDNANRLMNMGIQVPTLLIPIGLSFYTFEAISLLSDVYSNKPTKVKSLLSVNEMHIAPEMRESLLDVYLYITFFPTIVSGPIVRYHNFLEGYSKPLTAESFNRGIERFAIGLCKKALLADKIVILADFYFDATAIGNSLSSAGLWIGSIAYTLQLYFDFSGYTDMAIGIAAILGFDLPENFKQPYLAESIQEFWRRWHISLSSWFRDYVYIPLGGNRCSVGRHIINLLIVWILTGIWHGADWSFVIWGLGYCILLIAEKYFKPLKKISLHWYGHVYTLFFVNLLWIPFRADNIQTASQYIRGMFSFTGKIEEKAISFIPILCLAITVCLPWKKWLSRFEKNRIFQILRGIAIIGITMLAICAVLNSTYSPYIYGNF